MPYLTEGLASLIFPVQVSAPVPVKTGAFGLVEFEVDPKTGYRNPFDPDEIAVTGDFESNDGSHISLPAFWDGKGFRLRFCPTQSGRWKLAVSVKTPTEQSVSQAETFNVSASKSGGFARIYKTNSRYFALDSGKSFVPIGPNLCWPDKSGVRSYDARFKRLHDVGGNFARIWTTQERRLETKEAGLGRYDSDSAAYYDSVFKLADKHEIRTMLTLDDYRVLAKTDYFNAHWDSSPYNAVNGGPLKQPTDFFTDPLCRRLYKQRLRYLVARYSAFTSLGFWEIYNEQDNIPDPGVPTEWFREMTGYLASIDPYHHPITTSYSWRDKPEVWQSPALAITQRHLYGQGDTVDFVSMIKENAAKLDRYDKPRLIGEFGITWKEPDIALDKAKLGTPLHDALWASIMTGDAGGALTWWWDNYLEPLDLWPVFVGISKFVAPIDFAHRNFRPLSLSAEGLDVVGLQDGKSGETIAWIHDPASNWKNDAAGTQPRKWENVQLLIPSTRAVAVEIWDTRKGEVIGRQKIVLSGRGVEVHLPPFQRDIALKIRPFS